MPYKKVSDHPECPTSKPIGVVKESDGELMGCHSSEESADDQLAALYAQEEERMEIPAIIVSVQDGLIEAFAELEAGISRFIDRLTKREWDGSASNYESTEQYCSACLIDVNQGDSKTQDHCMLPVKSPGSDSYDMEGIQAAAGGHGISQVQKPDDVPQDEWDAAVTKAANTIISQYDENGKTAPDSVYTAAGKEPPKSETRERAIGMGQVFSQVDAQLYQMDSWPWLHDIYLDGGEMFAIASTGGKLYRFTVNLENNTVSIGEAEEVEPLFKPMSSSPDTPRTRTMVFRTIEGKWRWVSISCTAILNRVGEIDSRALFDSIIRHAEETGKYPFRTFYHLGEALKYGQADYLARDGFTFISSGLFDIEGPNKALALAEIEARQKEPDVWGESIGYLPTAAPVLVPVAAGVEVLAFDEGIGREISCCLEADAAALFTQSTTQEVSRMLDKIKEKFARLGVPEEEISAFEEKVDATNRAVTDEGLIARTDDLGDDTPDPASAEDVTDEQEEDTGIDVEVEEELLEEVAGRTLSRLVDPESPVMQALAELATDIQEMRATTTETLEAIANRLEVLEQDEDAKRQRWLDDLPRGKTAKLVVRPRVTNAEPDEEEDTKPDGPEDYSAHAEAVLKEKGLST